MIKLPLLLLVLLAASRIHAAEDPVTTPQPAERYAEMAQKSPFALATVAAPTAQPEASFAANWYVAGIGRLDDTDFVTIKSRDATMQFSLFGRETHAATGVTLASVDWSETVGKSSVTLSKGTEMAKLEFNEAEVRGPAVASADGAPAPNMAPDHMGVMGVPGSDPNAQPVTVAPGSTGRPPRNPLLISPPQAGRPARAMPPMPGSPGEPRRRVRPIPIPREMPAPVPAP